MTVTSRSRGCNGPQEVVFVEALLLILSGNVIEPLGIRLDDRGACNLSGLNQIQRRPNDIKGILCQRLCKQPAVLRDGRDALDRKSVV